MSTSTPTAANGSAGGAAAPPAQPDPVVETVRSTVVSERLLEDSWQTRSRRVTSRELAAEAVAAVLFLGAAGTLALAAGGSKALDLSQAALLVVLYALVSRVEFPIGAGYVVPSYLVLVPMLVLLPPALVPLLAALGLVLGALGQWLTRRAGPERLLFSIPDAWHAVGPALVLVLLAPGGAALTLWTIYLAAFVAGCLFDLASATLREAAALDVAPRLQVRVLSRVWIVDACLAPVGLLAAQSASHAPARVLLVVPLGALLLIMARDRSAHIAQAMRRLEQASTDVLTGLGNRRLLTADLAERLESGAQSKPLLLMLFDLDGFKRYNDTFGHLAGDAVLARLGGKLAAAVRPHGTAYRLGGDEFCVLLEGDPERFAEPLAAAAWALTEAGEEFTIRPSFGAVLLPAEADGADHALQLADERMYARKRGRTSDAQEQARDVLVRSMQARQPGLQEHSSGVAELAVCIGRRLGLDAEGLDEVTRAAELHDVGKVGIPDAILAKPSALDPEEWEFMRQHTILGERILSAAPALRPVARVVRSTHERWDGHGYPDGLTGEQIPLSARIVAVCDAYEAMVAHRPYRTALGHAYACQELAAEAGRQFDPAVVAAFLDEVGSWGAQELTPARVSRGSEDDRRDEIGAYLRELLAACPR
jgi:diguanylate cyclase (GGDEF)-like protein